MSLSPIFNQKPKIDYSEYEKLLKKISSVQLQNLTDLEIEEQYIEIVANKILAENYIGQIQKLLNETSEKV